MLRGQKDLAVAGERFFKRAHARLAAHHERRHHVGEDHHVPDGHHGQLAGLGLFARRGHKDTFRIGRATAPSAAGKFARRMFGLYREIRESRV